MAPRSSSRHPILCAVLDAMSLGPRPRDAAAALFESGVDWIQLRDRSLESNALRNCVEAIIAARDALPETTKTRAVIVNKRTDIALATAADGVHLGFDAIDPQEAISLLPKAALIGLSLHSVEEVRAAARATTEATSKPAPKTSAPTHAQIPRIYAHLAPIWDPRSKPASRPPLGVELLSEACDFGLPILAQGGLDPDRATLAIAAGAAGIAVTGILGEEGNQTIAVRQLREALDRQFDEQNGTSEAKRVALDEPR